MKKYPLIPRNIKVSDPVWIEASRLGKLHLGLNTSELIRGLLEEFIDNYKNKRVSDSRQAKMDI